MLLGKDFGLKFSHTLFHKDPGPVMDDECPAHDLCTHIEKLGNYTLSVPWKAEYSFERGYKVDGMILIIVSWHPDHGDDDQHHQDDYANNNIRVGQYAQVMVFNRFKFSRGQIHASCSIEGVQPGLYEILGNEHSCKGSHGIEGLGKIQAPGGSFFGSHGKDVWIGTGFEKGKSAGKYEIGKKEGPVNTNGTGRYEQ